MGIQKIDREISRNQPNLGGTRSTSFKISKIINRTIAEVVKEKLTKQNASKHLETLAKSKLSPEDQLNFIRIVEKELRSLHIGNIARYNITDNEFKDWVMD